MVGAIAIDVGGTTIKSGLVTAAGQFSHAHSTPTPSGAPELAEVIAQLAAEITTCARAEGRTVIDTIGVGVPGIVDEVTGTGVLSTNLGWENVPLRKLCEHATRRPIAFGHDVRSGALAEMAWGTGSETMIYVAIGTGIGAGVILAGRAWVNRGYAGELGQALVSLHGQDVVLEHYASARGIQTQYRKRSGCPAAGAKEVFMAAQAGDRHAQATIEVAVTLLARALGTTMSLLGSMDIVLGGGLAQAGQALTEPLEQALARRLQVSPMPAVRVARLGSYSQALGAGYRALHSEGIAILVNDRDRATGVTWAPQGE